VLPVAIGLLARLVGLGGLGKKVEEFIESIRERLDKAITKLINKIKAKIKKLFGKGKRGEKGKHGETDPADERKHGKYIREAREALEAPPPEPMSFSEFETHKRKQADKLESTYGKKLDKSVGMTIDFDKVSKKDEAMHFQVDVKPNNSSGDGVATNAEGLAEQFEADLGGVHATFAAYATGILGQFDEDQEGPFSGWSEVVEAAIQAGEGGRLNQSDWNEAIVSPLNQSHDFGEDFAHEWAVSAARRAKKRVKDGDPSKKEKQSLQKMSDKGVPKWVVNYKTSIYEQKAPFLSETLEYIQQTEWDASRQRSAAGQVREAFEERISMGPTSAPAPPSAEIKEAFQRKNAFVVLEKLVGENESVSLSQGGSLTARDFVSLMKDSEAGSGNRAYVADRIRAADPGKHEWIPGSHIGKVVAYAIETKGGDATETDAALAWVEAVDKLRTPTDQMVIRNVTYTPGEGSVTEGVEVTDEDRAQTPAELRRHPPKPGVLRQMGEPFHQILRDYFDEQVVKGSVVTPLDFVEELEPVLGGLLWDGELDTDRTEFTSDDEGAAELAGLLDMDKSGPWTMEEFKNAARERVTEIIKQLQAAAGGID
jgi:hypothetical protein